MVLGDLDFKHLNNCVSKTLKKFTSLQDSFKRKQPDLGPHFKDALDKLKKLQDALKVLEPTHKVDSMYKTHKEYVKLLRSSLESLVEKFEKSLKSPLTVEILCEYIIKFHYLALEINYFFPNGQITNEQVFGKAYAQEWWNASFESELFVKKEEFYDKFYETFREVSPIKAVFLETICFSSYEYVSKFDFDLFTRLFGNKEHLIRVFQRLVNHLGYLKNGTYASSINALELCRKPGSYIFRISTSKTGIWSIAYVDTSSRILQAMCYDWSVFFSLNYGIQQGIYRYPKGVEYFDDLSDLCELIGPREQLPNAPRCENCHANPINTRLEPCGHVCCRACYKEALGSKDVGIAGKCYKCSRDILCSTPIVLSVEVPSVPLFPPSRYPGTPCSPGSYPNSPTPSTSSFEQSQPEYNKADHEAAANAARYAYSGRHREFNNAVERILKACPMNDRNTIETNLRILAIQEGHSLDDSVDALILAGGDRERAGQFLRSGTSSSMNTFASQGHDPSHFS